MLYFFIDRVHKRWFYVKQQNRLIAALILNRLDAFKGWVINMVLLAPHVPATTSEFLILSALDTLEQEQCSFFSIGALPKAPLGYIQGAWPPLIKGINSVYQRMHCWFSLHERQRYWEKFNPRKEPSFLLVNSPAISIREAIALLRTFHVRFF